MLKLIDLAPNVKVVLLQGSHAAHAWERLVRRNPQVEADRRLTIVRSFHPSPQALFVKDPEERARRVARRAEAFEEVAALLR